MKYLIIDQTIYYKEMFRSPLNRVGALCDNIAMD